MTAPQWAQDLVLQVALDEGRDDVPELTWHRSKRSAFSSGRTWHTSSRIHVTAGTQRRQTQIPYRSGKRTGQVSVRAEQKLVLLHEVAHWLTPFEKQAVTYGRGGDWYDQDGNKADAPTGTRYLSHTATFWDTAWRLFRRYKVPLTYAKVREGNYRKGALVAARKRS